MSTKDLLTGVLNLRGITKQEDILETLMRMVNDVNSSDRTITISETISEEVQGTDVTDDNSLKQIGMTPKK